MTTEESSVEQNIRKEQRVIVPKIKEAYLSLINLVTSQRPQAWQGYDLSTTGYFFQVCFGSLRIDEEQRKMEAFRGYVQVLPTDLPQVVGMLIEITQRRLELNKRTEFKVMLGTYPSLSKSYSTADVLSEEDLEKIGVYVDVPMRDALLVVYGKSANEVIEVLTALANSRGYREIDENFRSAFEQQGVELRGTKNLPLFERANNTLSLNDESGPREDQV